jgi:biopolymer transport protein ExbD
MPISRRKRDRGPDNLSPNLTPLLDVVLQLITFFMMLIHFGVTIEGATKAVRLPIAPAALPSRELSLDRLAVAIDAQGRLLADDGAREGRAAETWWDQQAEKRRAGKEALGGPVDELPTLVVVRADREASYGAVRRALVAAQERGFAHFTLIVKRGAIR